MKLENIKKISAEVSNDCWKKLKIISVHKETTLTDLIKDILEKSVSGKRFNVDIPELETN